MRNRSQTQIWVSCHLKSSFSHSQLPGQWRIHWTGGGLCLATGTWYVWQGTGISRNGHKNCQTSSSCSTSRRWSCPEGDSSWDMRHCHPRYMFFSSSHIGQAHRRCLTSPSPQLRGLHKLCTVSSQFQGQLIRERRKNCHPDLIYQLNCLMIRANLSWGLFANLIELY